MSDALTHSERRSFLLSAIAVLGAMVFGDRLGRWIARDRMRSSATSLNNASFEIAGASALTVGKALAFDLPYGNKAAGLVVHTNGGYVAFERACPHLGCPVLWSEAEQRIECPCHAAAFNVIDGSVISGPPPRGLTPIPVVARDGRVYAASRAGDTDV